jgi:hypothetical protein
MSDDGTGEATGDAAVRAITQVADLLARWRLLPTNTLHALRVPEAGDGVLASVAAAICQLLPERIVAHEAAAVVDAESYAELVRRYAAATCGAWQPLGLRSALDLLDGEAMVEFDHDGERVRWRFAQPTETVSLDFTHLVNSFAATALGGAFVSLPTKDEQTLAIYLPESAAAELSTLLAEIAVG